MGSTQIGGKPSYGLPDHPHGRGEHPSRAAGSQRNLEFLVRWQHHHPGSPLEVHRIDASRASTWVDRPLAADFQLRQVVTEVEEGCGDGRNPYVAKMELISE